MKTGKKIWITLGIIVLGIIVAAFIVYYSLTSSATVKAQVHVENGQVFVDGKQISSDMKLAQGDVIETGTDGKATVILYESVLISLDENTKISLDELTQEHPSVSQTEGTTWNKFTKLFGAQEYSISTGNSVASVRGTFFGLRKEKILGGEGQVEYKINGIIYQVTKNKVIESINGTINERNATSNETDELNRNMLREIQVLKILREKEIAKHPQIKKMVMDKMQIDEAGLRSLLERVDNEEFDVDELQKQSPVEAKSIEKVVQITKKIIELKQELAAQTAV
jgi:hypothetical protein